MMRKNTFIFTLLSIILLVTACSFPLKDTSNNEKEPNEKQTEEDTNSEDKNSIPATSDRSETPILPNEELQKGDVGENVLLLQETLIHIGYPIEKSEKFDELTTWAITDFQLQQDNIHITGFFDSETKKAIELVLEGGIEVNSGSKLSKPKGNQQHTEKIIIENPFDVLALINKENTLPSDYIPEDLVTPNVRFPFTEDLPQKQLRKVAAEALEKMFEAADQAGLDLFALSGYRSYDRQEAIFASNVQKHGEEAANNFSARPGESEHQSGLTMDVTTPSVNFDLVIAFGETDEGKWLKEHASEFGFIIRYLEGKEHITKYQYEPWHLRYVGVKTAKEIMDKNITLEEYFEGK